MPPLIIPAKVSRLTQRLLGTNDRPIMWSEFNQLLADINTVGGEINQGGNSFGAVMSIGTNDNYSVDFRVNGTRAMRISATSLYGSANPILTFDRTLRDSSFGLALDWENRKTKDSSGAYSINWESRLLYYTDGTTPIVDWINGIISRIDGTTSVDWQNNSLANASGRSTVNYDSKILINPTSFPINAHTIDWGNLILKNNADVQVASWNDTAFTCGNAQAVTIAGFKVKSTAGTASHFVSTATPEGAITSTIIGDLSHELTNGDLYIKRTNSGNTGWQRFAHTGMITFKGDATTSYTVVASDDLKTIELTNVAARAFILPNVSTVRTGFVTTVIDGAATAGAANITVSSASTIIGDVSININSDYRKYQSNGSRWMRIG